MKQDQFTQEVVDAIFDLYRKALRSHYPAPRLKVIQEALENEGVYEYKVGPAKVWQSILRFRMDKAEIQVEFDYVLQPQYSKMKEDIESMKAVFDQSWSEYQKNI